MMDLERDLVRYGVDGMLEYLMDEKYILNLNLIKFIGKLSMDEIFYD